jgi:hypothetical protein
MRHPGDSGDRHVWSASTVSGNCHCEARRAEAISCLTSRRPLIRQEIASALRASQ